MGQSSVNACDAACRCSAVYGSDGKAADILPDQAYHGHTLSRLRNVACARLPAPALLPCLTAMFVLFNRETCLLEHVSMRVKDILIALGFGFTIAVYIVRMAFFGIP